MNKNLVSKVADVLVEMGSLINDMYIAGAKVSESAFGSNLVIFTYPKAYENSQENPKEKCVSAVKAYTNFTVFVTGLLGMLDDLEDVQPESLDAEIQDFRDFCYKCFSDGTERIRYAAKERDEVWTSLDVLEAKEKADRDIKKFREGVDRILNQIPSGFEEV